MTFTIFYYPSSLSQKSEKCTRACLHLKFCPRFNSTVCVVKHLPKFTTKKLKKNLPRGKLTPPVLTSMKFSPRGKLTSNELYMHVFTHPRVTWCTASVFSQSYSNIPSFWKSHSVWSVMMTGNKSLGIKDKTQKWHIIFMHLF